jgi:23S rRNA pseudouridine2605 synthase
MKERLQKYLANKGFGSRRHIERLIEEGRFMIDGVPACLGDKVDGHSQLMFDGTAIRQSKHSTTSTKVLVYYKPEGEVCTRFDPDGRKTVFSRLPKINNSRWVMVGRLDINTSGLLLFTNNGELANRLMHPSFEVERKYAVRVLGEVSAESLDQLLKGVVLEDGPAKFTSITEQGGDGSNHWYHVTLREGRNREVRRLWESQEVQVSRLIRIKYGPISLPKGLTRGKCEFVTERERTALLAKLGVD